MVRSGAVALFMLALALRISGLSHDLHHERIYHPDTPKQIRAAERFIQGEYYTYIGGRDYEGYPYFNSHIAAACFHVYAFARDGLRAQLGLPHDPLQPDFMGLFWLTRWLNATLSALTVLLVWFAGRRFFSPAIGWLAGLLLALSPVDITAAHFATGDTATSFFATAAMLAGLGVLRSQGQYRYYVLAALAAGAAFSSKYHGGMALIGALIAHVYLYPFPKRIFSRPSLLRLTALGASLIAAILITSPALLVYPEAAFKDILQFVQYTSSFGMTPEMAARPLWSRFALGMHINMPALADVLGPAVVIALLLALILRHRPHETWLIAALPIVYILIGLATKPLTHPVYHTIATPSLFLLAAAGMVALGRLPCKQAVWRIVTVALLLASLTYLTQYTRRELFFFKHNDTRWLAEVWAKDNIPSSYFLHTGAYTFRAQGWAESPESAEANAYIFSDRDGRRAPPPGTSHTYSFTQEESKLSVFRNWNLHVYLPHENPRLAFQPMPSLHEVNVIMTDAPWHVRTPKKRIVRAPERDAPTLSSPHPLERIAVTVQCGPEPALLRLRVAGHKHVIQLAPAERQLLIIDSPRPLRMPRLIRHFYATDIRVQYGEVSLFMATEPDEIAWSLLHSGNHESAEALFEQLDHSDGHTLASFLRRLTPSPTHEFQSPIALGFPRVDAFLEPGFYKLTWAEQQKEHPFPTDPWGYSIPYTMPDEQAQELLFEINTGEPLVRIVQTNTASVAHLHADPQTTINILRTRLNTGDTLRSYADQRHPTPRVPASVRLANGFRLSGYALQQNTVRRGDVLRMNLFWDAPDFRLPIHRYAAWIHGIPEDQSTALFFGDRSLKHVLAIPLQSAHSDAYYIDVLIPEDIPPGVYRIKTGLWIPSHRRNIRVRESDLPFDKRGVFIGEIKVTE